VCDDLPHLHPGLQDQFKTLFELNQKMTSLNDPKQNI